MDVEVLASQEQLNSIGVDYDVTGSKGKVTHVFPKRNGFPKQRYEVLIDLDIGSKKGLPPRFINMKFDIPVEWLKKIS